MRKFDPDEVGFGFSAIDQQNHQTQFTQLPKQSQPNLRFVTFYLKSAATYAQNPWLCFLCHRRMICFLIKQMVLSLSARLAIINPARAAFDASYLRGRFRLWPNFERKSVLINENAEMPKIVLSVFTLEAKVQRTSFSEESR